MFSKALKMVVFGAMLTAMSANSALIYDADVTPSDLIFGSGNVNGFFVVDSGSNVEVGLRAKVPYQGIYNSNGAGVYSMSTGDHPKWGAPGAAWNFEFSVNVDLDESGGSTFSDYDILMMVDYDPSAGQSWFSFDPVAFFADNATQDETLAQNSQNVGWLSGWASFNGLTGPVFDNNVPATYDFVLSVSQNDTVLAKSLMTVEVDGGATPVSEPSAVVFMFSYLLAFGFFRRKKQRKSI